MGDGAKRGTELDELDELSRNDGKPTLLLAIAKVGSGCMVSQLSDIECNQD